VTVGAWLEARTPRLPPALAKRVRSAVGAAWSRPEADTHDVCEAAAEELLNTLLQRHETGRGAALDLLCADALTTYAFEYTASVGGDLGADAAAAMQRIAATGVRFAGTVAP
jgi:hypothetical protein